jgi:hypothetical protein
VFWTRSRREARRQLVLDELLALDPAERRGRLDLAVTAGDVKPDEVEEALKLVQRLDVLRVMTIPSSGRLPGGILPIRQRPTIEVEPVAADDAAAAIDVSSSSPDAAEPAAGHARSGIRSSRRRRLRRVAEKSARANRTQPAPVEESWPSMEWLRP